ncbi:MAG: FGGY family carbohydrate kinase [Armatimonadetes bacterium]|nr:FGGY family carbohydrate kinase [Armatimonadota bacterium]
MSYIGLDIGTTGCKAVAFDENGHQLAAAYREYPVLSPHDGWAEIDSALVCQSCLEVIREAASRCNTSLRSSLETEVRGIGISSQGEAFTPVGPSGEFFGNAMVSSDTRAAAISENWSREFGREKLYEITGHTAHPMFTLFKLIWVRDNRPDVWRQAKMFHCFEDLIHTRLGVEPAMSWPLAGRTMMFDVRKHDWDDSILNAMGLDRSKLPRTLPAGEVVGRVPSAICRDLGLADGAIVVAGGHDQPCGALGAGVTRPGMAVYGTGTVECITPAFSEPVFSSDLFANNLCTYDFTIPGMYTTVAFSLTGGNLLKWFRDEFGQAEVEQANRTGENAYSILIEHMASEPTSLMVLPYFTPSGTPYFDTRTKGAITGLRLTTTRGEILRALLEGVAFEMRLNLDILAKSGIAVKELVAIGGGARNPIWTQLKADVLNTPIKTVAVTEAGCLGVAMLACAADTQQDVKSLASKWVRVTGEVTPDPKNAEFYALRFEHYLKLYSVIKELY